MAKTTSLEGAEIALTSSMEEPQRAAPDPETPFRLLVLGDFSGRGSRGVSGPAALGFDRLPVRVDRDNFAEILEETEVALTLRLGGHGGPETTFRLRRLEDFHPDQILERTPAFGALRRTREELQDPATFAEAAATVRSWTGAAAAAAPAPAKPGPAARSTSEDVVADLLAGAREKAGRRPEDLDRFVRGIAAPHAVPAEDPQVPELVAAVDAMIGSWIRNALHHPGFQALEAAWRGLAWLVSRLETDSQLQVWMLDVSKAELAEDLRSARILETSGWRKILVSQALDSLDAEPWAAVGALYAFDRTVEDVALLARLARVAREADAPLIAAASPGVVGCAGFGEAPDPADWRPGAPDAPAAQIWAALRELPEARWLGLAAPRFLLRLPYGKDTDPAETFAFEEMPEGAHHEDYLWGGPALVCLALLGEAFAENGWRFRPGSVHDVGNLPLHVFTADGARQIKPCAEANLSPRATEVLLDAGMMPLLSLHGRDAVRLPRFQSIAAPLAPLAGRWSA
jgi:type VI secretion system protein ImpC